MLIARITGARIRLDADQNRIVVEPVRRKRQIDLFRVAAVQRDAARVARDPDDLPSRSVRSQLPGLSELTVGAQPQCATDRVLARPEPPSC